jgi:hypothetical protein
MPEKVSTKINRLERELADEIAYSLELRQMISQQANTIKALTDYFVLNGLANSHADAIEISKNFKNKNRIGHQLSFDF